jgi:uncharacterized LabA/DUF88 family protein
MGLGKEIFKDLYKGTIKHEDRIVMVVGDTDYVPVVESILEEGISVDIAFWDHASQELKRMVQNFISLNPHLNEIQR